LKGFRITDKLIIMFFKKEKIPNYLTIVRILLVPVFLILFFNVNIEIAGIVFLIAGATDVIDGYIARKYNWVTDIGKLLDPLADKLMQISAIISLGIVERLPIWLIAFIFLKELGMIIGAAFILKRERVYVKSDWYGKLSTVLLYIDVFLSIFMFGIVGKGAIWFLSALVLISMAFSLVMYAIQAKKNIFDIKK